MFATDRALCGIVTARLASRWSPQQDKGWLKVTYPGRSGLQLPHQSIGEASSSRPAAR